MGKWRNSILTGDAENKLGELPESSVHMVMTSPPYYGLRDYGEDEQIGLEESLDEYIQKLVDVFREVRRVLRPDGSAWLNLGDSYAQSGKSNHDKSGTAPNGQGHQRGHDAGVFGAKNKMLVPHRVAIALQEDAWIVRNDVTWVKPNPMPSSVKDRLNTSTEQIFHLVPNPDYWYDLDAIREPHKGNTIRRRKNEETARDEHNKLKGGDGFANHNLEENAIHPAGKNPGDVFEVTTKPFPDAHFAVYPPELVEKPIKATGPPKVCVECGAPYERDVERETVYDHETTEKTGLDRDRNDTNGGDGHDLRNGVYSSGEFKGWNRTCDCDTNDTQAGIVLDPFAGAGTTLLKAKELGRRFVGIELNPKYADMARARIGLQPHDPSNVRDNANQTGFETFADGGTQ